MVEQNGGEAEMKPSSVRCITRISQYSGRPSAKSAESWYDDDVAEVHMGVYEYTNIETRAPSAGKGRASLAPYDQLPSCDRVDAHSETDVRESPEPNGRSD